MPWHSCSHPRRIRDAGTETGGQGKRLNERTRAAQQPRGTPFTGLHVNAAYIVNAGYDRQCLQGPFGVTGSYMRKRRERNSP